jgi:hypothetical protein
VLAIKVEKKRIDAEFSSTMEKMQYEMVVFGNPLAFVIANCRRFQR